MNSNSDTSQDIILVDENDNQIGTDDKLSAHKTGKMHRAFSVLIFNKKGEMLLQRRAITKYHCGGLWTNACCSHPRPGESVEDAAHRRLEEELGFDCDLRQIFSFTYKTELDHGLTENEFDHVFIGTYEGAMKPNSGEVDEVRWLDQKTLKEDIKRNPNQYTPWFKIIIDREEISSWRKYV